MRLPDNLIPKGFLPGLFVARREPNMDPVFFGNDINIENAPVQLDPQNAPDPVRYSEFSAEGRAPTERWSTVPVALHMNIGGIQSVMEDTFLAGKVRPQFLTLMRNGYGGQLPWNERQNIDRGESRPYGNRVAVASPEGIPAGQSAFGIAYSNRRF